jgi:hypothetical protein
MIVDREGSNGFARNNRVGYEEIKGSFGLFGLLLSALLLVHWFDTGAW